MFSFVSSSPVLKALVLPDVTFTGRKIGAGAYSSVEEVVLSGAVCAAKTFHVPLQDLSQLSRADVESATHQFVEELQLMSTLRHPNVVQFLGVCFEPDSGAQLPALVMERLTCSLHDLLETNPSYRAKPLPIKCSILHSVASGLAYLHHHSPPVIHSNLSARNILLDSAGRAKIADICEAPFIHNFGTAATTAKASLYIPPEAFSSSLSSKETSKTKSVYSTSIDIFSLGIIAIFTLGEALPCEPLEPTYTDKESGLVKYRTEVERRSHYLQPITDLLNQGHPLLTLIQSCLCNNPSERPTVDEVLVLTERAKSMCAGDGMNNLELIESLQSQPGSEVAALRARNQELQQELETCCGEKLKLEEQILTKETQLANALESLRQGGTLESKDREISKLRQQLQSCLLEKKALLPSQDVEPTSSLPGHRDTHKSLSSENQRREAMDTLSTAGTSLTKSTSTSEKTLRVQCYHQKPIKLKSLTRGSAAIDGNFAYLAPCDSNTVFRYNAINGEGTVFPNSLYQNSAVVTIGGRVVLIGGASEGHVTNKALTLHYSGEWVEEYPPMNYGRSHCAAVCVRNGKLRNHVVVIGGRSEHGSHMYDVQFLNTATKSWYSLTPLPQSPHIPSATLCGNTLCVIGNIGKAYSSSIQSLTSYNDDESNPPPASLVWKALPPPPVIHAAIASLRGQLVLIGGCRADRASVSSAVYQLVGGVEWIEIGCTLVPRRGSLTVSPSPDKIIVLGGVGAGNTVELCNAD